jgi:hypothetical protein
VRLEIVTTAVVGVVDHDRRLVVVAPTVREGAAFDTDGVGGGVSLGERSGARVSAALGFGKLFKSLRIYDWKTIKPEGLGNLYAKLKT